MARTLAESSSGPREQVSASAVGYYGDRGHEPGDEQAKSGT
jgi:NAD dependent epimerase/dehydratase family enzyme